MLASSLLTASLFACCALLYCCCKNCQSEQDYEEQEQEEKDMEKSVPSTIHIGKVTPFVEIVDNSKNDSKPCNLSVETLEGNRVNIADIYQDINFETAQPKLNKISVKKEMIRPNKS